MLELAAAGAQVMHARAVEIAARFDVDLRLGSAFEVEDTIGTLVTKRPERMEELVLTGLHRSAVTRSSSCAACRRACGR
jgi:aspartate kinase